MNQRVSSCALLIGFATFALLCGSGRVQSQSGTGQPIQIGISQAASGPYGDYLMRQSIKPMLLAVDDANAHGGVNGRRVVGIVEDNKGDATIGLSVAHKLIDVDKVDALWVGPTPPALATLPITEAAHILILSAAQAPKLSQSPWGSSASPPADKAGIAFADFAIAKKAARIATLAEDNDSIAISMAAFKATLGKAGIESIAAETFRPGSQDFTGQLTKIRAARPDLLLVFSLAAPAYGYALKQMEQLNFRPQYVLTWFAVTDPQVRQIAGDAANGAYFIRLPVDPDWNARVFKPRTGYDVDASGATAYDSIAIYLTARAAAQTDDREKIRDAMFNFKGYQGALGQWGFNGTGVSQVKYEAARLEADGSTTAVPF
jgi:branched-chain amino acid transport system substrate-binding protein